MTAVIPDTLSSDCLTREAGGWIDCRGPRPDIESAVLRLVAVSAAPRPGNLRLGIHSGQVTLFGELPDPDGLLTLPAAEQLFRAAADGSAADLSPAEVACLLGDTGYVWTQPDDTTNVWQAASSDHAGRNTTLRATPEASGIEIAHQLVAWETDLADPQRLAIARFLAAAHARVRFARCVLLSREVTVNSWAARERLNVELTCSVRAVVTVSRRLVREVRALADPAVAHAYLGAESWHPL